MRTKYYWLRFIHTICFVALTTSCLAVNVITNGDFENGFTNWNNVANGGGAATYSVGNTGAPQGTNFLEANVTALGGNGWDVQSLHSGVSGPLINGNDYTLSFYAKADAPGHEIRFVLQNGVWSSIFFGALDTGWTLYSVNFTAAETNPILRIQYQDVGVYFIDDIKIDDSGVITMPVSATLDANIEHQEMEGFGGAMTWFIYRVDDNPDRAEILDSLVNGVGIDLLRVKNWYYPDNYPADKSPTVFEDWNSSVSFQPTMDIVNDVRALNSDIQVLMSSWGPPPALKSNGALSGGTLSKTGGTFDYAELGQYYDDMLDYCGFDPDWISFQNEPGYLNTWTTCEWRPTETVNFPGLDQGLDSIYEAIKDRSDLPKILAPESENIGNASWDNSLNTYREFTNPLRNKPYIDYYAYHLYNYYQPNLMSNTSYLNIVRDEFQEHPNIMTEFSNDNYSWLETAAIIQNTLIEADASGYIYWSMIWDSAKDNAMIGIDNSDNWVINEEYYVLKHFAKFVDKGYKRINLTGTANSYKSSAFKSPSGNEITIILLNNNSATQDVTMDVQNWNVASETAYQSTVTALFQPVSTDIENGITLPPYSLTTIVLTGGQLDCNGDAGGSAYYDSCGVCVGGNTTLTPCTQDCNNDWGGTAYIDSCSTCVEGNTTLTPCTQDCNNDWGGTAYFDSCSTCVEGNTTLTPCTQDCNNDWGGTAFMDSCSQCAAGSTGVTPILDPLSCITGVESTTENQDIYPNPTTGLIHFRKKSDFIILNIVGVKLLEGKSIQADLSALPRGIYLIHINDSKTYRITRN